MNTINTCSEYTNILDNEQICYELYYLLSQQYKHMLSLGLVNKRTYTHLCRFAEARDGRIVGFRTIDRARHGEWIINTYSTQYSNGTIMSWSEYLVPVPGWCEPSFWSLKRVWRLSVLDKAYGVNYWYNNCALQSIDITITGTHAAVRQYDWCPLCREKLPEDIAGTPQRPNIEAIEQFLVAPDSPQYSHIKLPVTRAV